MGSFLKGEYSREANFPEIRRHHFYIWGRRIGRPARPLAAAISVFDAFSQNICAVPEAPAKYIPARKDPIGTPRHINALSRREAFKHCGQGRETFSVIDASSLNICAAPELPAKCIPVGKDPAGTPVPHQCSFTEAVFQTPWARTRNLLDYRCVLAEYLRRSGSFSEIYSRRKGSRRHSRATSMRLHGGSLSNTVGKDTKPSRLSMRPR